MISNLSSRLTGRLISGNAINEDERELYEYGFFVLLSHLLFISITLILGIIMKCPLESAGFYIAFQFIRRYAGGYHASTEARCELLSTISIALCIMVIRLAKIYDFEIALAAAASICAVLIFIFCPLDTPEKPFSEKEHAYFRKASIIICAIITLLAAISFFFKLKFAFAPLCMSLILEALLLVSGKIKQAATKAELH